METEVKFTENLDRMTCAMLLIETVKYLLFHRYQMPLPFDQLKTEDERDRKMENARRSPRTRPLPSVLKKKRQLIADVEELLTNLHQYFLQFDVYEVVLLFGATVVNPKETYTIRFYNTVEKNQIDRMKAECTSGKENLDNMHVRSKFVDKCCRELARALFIDPSLNDKGELAATSIHCFILAPRKLDTTWYQPKASFKLPKKGKCCAIRIYSGIDGRHRIFKSNDNHEGIGTLEDHNEQDMLWFQAPVIIKGYRESYNETAASSMWKK